jgi:hypothetical protein
MGQKSNRKGRLMKIWNFFSQSSEKEEKEKAKKQRKKKPSVSKRLMKKRKKRSRPRVPPSNKTFVRKVFGSSSSSSSSSSSPPPPNVPVPMVPPVMTAEEVEEQNKVFESWDLGSLREETRKAVQANRFHIHRFESAASKYEEWLSKASPRIITDKPHVPRKFGDATQVEPWPENGPWRKVVASYLHYYVKNTPGVYGHKTVNSVTAKGHMSLVYCAALRKCNFSADRDGDRARRDLGKMSFTAIDVHGQPKKVKVAVLQFLKSHFGKEYQQSRMTAKGTTPSDNDWMLKVCGESQHANQASSVSEKRGRVVLFSF